MDALQGYGSDSDNDPASQEEQISVDPSDAFGLTALGQTSPPPKRHKATTSTALTIAPSVIDDTVASNALLIRPSDTTMNLNIPYKDMTAPLLGPSNPFASTQRQLGAQQNHLTGHVQAAAMNDFDFSNQQKTFQLQGYARNPSMLSEEAWVGDAQAAIAAEGATSVELRGLARGKTKRNGRSGDPSIVQGEGAYVGPWGGWQDESIHVQVVPSEDKVARTEELSTLRQRQKIASEACRIHDQEAGTEKSIFHGKSMYDYQGRTYMHIPTDVHVSLTGDPAEQEAFLPKTCVHTFTGHTKGISALRLFPDSGHVMLSASMDTKIKLWDVYHQGNCLRTFMGHSKALRDICFSNDGRRFLSAGYDRQIKLWDTETGACLKAFSNNKVPYCVKFNPDPDKQHVFLAGMSDKKIIQWDTNSSEIIQEYDQHLGPVNTITFVDENRRFVTTSDDKTMRAWDYDIPVVIKYVADPTMHSMPAVTVHPNKKWLACQSMDNQILVFSADSFRQNRKKVFRGHTVAGFACQISFSPDGRFISSGDGDGNLVFWDWKSGRLLKRLPKAHKEAVITHEWLPHQSSKLVTGGWDGVIKMWD